MHIGIFDMIKTNSCNPFKKNILLCATQQSSQNNRLPSPDTQTLISDSNGMTGAMAESHVLKHLSVVLDCNDVQYAVNCRLMDQLLWQFSSEAVHLGCYESIAFNGWWEGLCLLGYYCQ